MKFTTTLLLLGTFALVFSSCNRRAGRGYGPSPRPYSIYPRSSYQDLPGWDVYEGRNRTRIKFANPEVPISVEDVSN